MSVTLTSSIFLNLSMGNALRRVDRATGKIEGEAQVPAPDNVTWTPDGKRLLVASLRSLDPAEFTPAPGQGAIAVEARADEPAAELASRLNDPDARRCLDAERAVLSAVDAGCHTPFGAWCRPADAGLVMTAILERDGELQRAGTRGEDPLIMASLVAGELLGGDV